MVYAQALQLKAKILEQQYELNKTKKKILEEFFSRGEINRPELKKALGKAYSNIYYATDDLLKAGLIKVSREEPARNKKLSVKYYVLTSTGLETIIYILLAEKLKNKKIPAYEYPSREILNEIEKVIKPVVKHKSLLAEWKQKLSEHFLPRFIIDWYLKIAFSTMSPYIHVIPIDFEKEIISDYVNKVFNPNNETPYYAWLREKMTAEDKKIIANFLKKLIEKGRKYHLMMTKRYDEYDEKISKFTT